MVIIQLKLLRIFRLFYKMAESSLDIGQLEQLEGVITAKGNGYCPGGAGYWGTGRSQDRNLNVCLQLEYLYQGNNYPFLTIILAVISLGIWANPCMGELKHSSLAASILLLKPPSTTSKQLLVQVALWDTGSGVPCPRFLKNVITLLRYNSHTRQFYHLKCTIPWFLAYPQSCARYHNQFRAFSQSLKEIPCPLAVIPYFLSTPPASGNH